MKAALLGTYSDKPRVAAFRESLEERGISVVHIPDSRRIIAEDFDFAFTCGMHPPEHPARRAFAAIGRPVLILDLGYLRRATAEDQSGYHQLGIDRIGWIPETAPDTARFESLDLPVLPDIRRTDGFTLILGQVILDSQHPWTNPARMQKWLWQTARSSPAGPMQWRPHPLAKRGREWLIHPRIPTSPHADLSAALDDARSVVTWNSTAGIEAIRRGIPVYCAPEACYSPVSLSPFADRLAWFHRLAWAQWTLAELRDGTAWDYIKIYVHQNGALSGPTKEDE